MNILLNNTIIERPSTICQVLSYEDQVIFVGYTITNENINEIDS